MNFKPQTVELTDQDRRELVVNILTDAVILDRTYYAISLINQIGSFDGDGESSWDACEQINGYVNAFPLMGVSNTLRDEVLGGKLADVFMHTYKSELETGFTKDAKIVAEHIYIEWLDIVIKHNRKAFLKKVS